MKFIRTDSGSWVNVDNVIELYLEKNTVCALKGYNEYGEADQYKIAKFGKREAAQEYLDKLCAQINQEGTK